jgi:hypothetical protein
MAQAMNRLALFPHAILLFVDFEGRRVFSTPMLHGIKAVSPLLSEIVSRHLGSSDERPSENETRNKRDARQHKQADSDHLPPAPRTDAGLYRVEFGYRDEDSHKRLALWCRKGRS